MISAHESLIGTYKAIKSSQGPVAFQMFLNNHSSLLKAQINLHPWVFRYSILTAPVNGLSSHTTDALKELDVGEV